MWLFMLAPVARAEPRHVCFRVTDGEDQASGTWQHPNARALFYMCMYWRQYPHGAWLATAPVAVRGHSTDIMHGGAPAHGRFVPHRQERSSPHDPLLMILSSRSDPHDPILTRRSSREPEDLWRCLRRVEVNLIVRRLDGQAGDERDLAQGDYEEARASARVQILYRHLEPRWRS